MFRRFLVLVVLGVVFFAATPGMLAQAQTEKKSPIVFDPEISIPFFPAGPVSGTTFAQYIRAIFVVFIWSVGILATTMVIYGGVRWVAAAGNPVRINKAKDVIYNAIIGVVIALTSVLLLSLLDPRLVNFQGLEVVDSTQVVGIPFESDVALGLFNEAGTERPDPTNPGKTVGGCKTNGRRLITQEKVCAIGGRPFSWPVGDSPHAITSHVGPRSLKVGSRCHPGTDFSTSKVTGKPILAPVSGAVTKVERGAGEHIITLTGPTYFIRIVHVKSPSVTVGTKVQTGQLLGYSGGNPIDNAEIKKWSGGPHVHIELYTNDNELHDIVPCLQS